VSGLVLVIPELEPVFGDLRARHDPAARKGMPPHVTLIYPFKPYPALGTQDHARLAQVTARFPAFELTFLEVDRFDTALWLRPEPEAPIQALIAAIVEIFPAWPPYAGEFETVIPHVTLAQGPAELLDKLESVVRERLASPIRARVEAVSLFRTVRRRWAEGERYQLAQCGAQSSQGAVRSRPSISS
jgi:2'-5' RNA ligase